MALRSYYLPVGTSVFDLNHRAVPPVKWGVWAIIAEGKLEEPKGVEYL